MALLSAHLDGEQRLDIESSDNTGRRSKRLCRSPLQLLGEAIHRRQERWDSLSIELIAMGCGSSQTRLTRPALRKLLAMAVPVDTDCVGIASESTLLMECTKARTAAEPVILSCVRELVERHGADVSRGNRHGINPLIIASARGFPTIVKYLLKKNAAIECPGTGRFVTYFGNKARPVRGTMTALEWAAAMLAAETQFWPPETPKAVVQRSLQGLSDCVSALRYHTKADLTLKTGSQTCTTI